MLFEYFKHLISQTPKVFLGLTICCTAILMIPEKLLNHMGLLTYLESSKKYVFLVLLLSLSMLFSHFIFSLFPTIKGRFNGMVITHRGKKRLERLTKAEKEILRGYIQNDTMTRSFSCTDGNVLALEYEHILYRASSLGQFNTNFPYNIQPWVREYLKKHTELIS